MVCIVQLLNTELSAKSIQTNNKLFKKFYQVLTQIYSSYHYAYLLQFSAQKQNRLWNLTLILLRRFAILGELGISKQIVLINLEPNNIAS